MQPQTPAKPTAADRVGLVLQIALTLIATHMLLAIGFTLRWGEHAIIWRHPYVAVLLFLAGLGIRLAVSPGYRRHLAANRRRDVERIRRYAAGERRIPWRAAAAWVFLPSLLVYLINDNFVGSADTRPMLLVARSILHDADVALDEAVDAGDPPYWVSEIDGHWYSNFSLGPAVLAVPFVAVAEWAGGDISAPYHAQKLEKVAAATIAALSAMFLFLALLRLASIRTTALLTAFYALGSQNWSISSQALWQHGPVACCAAAVILIHVYRDRNLGGLAAFGQGLLLGFAVACRPTAMILLACWVMLTLSRRPRCVLPLLAGVTAAYLPFLLLHISAYGSVWGPYRHAAVEAAWQAHFATALTGNLLSPARGLLVYQPLLALAVTGVIPVFARRVGLSLAITLAAWVVAHLIVVSTFTHWWGGHCWGPRFLTELTPALVVLTAPAVEALRRRFLARALVSAALGWSVLLQAVGTLDPQSGRWMREPADIDHAPQRLWDWTDPPFLYWLRSGR